MKASVKTLSERTGFSPATVSNALNYKRGVSPKTAEIIFSEARKLGYFTENHYSKVKFVMYKKDGLIVENTPFFSQMIAGAEQECRSHEMELIVCNLDRREDNFDETVRQIQTDKNALVILLGTEMMDEDIDLILELEHIIR